MYKNGNNERNVKDAFPKLNERATGTLETKKPEATESRKTQAKSTGPKVLEISKTVTNLTDRQISKNNNRTPISPRYTISGVDDVPQKPIRRNRLQYVTPKEPTVEVETKIVEEVQKMSVVEKGTQTPPPEEKKARKPRIDYRTICTCDRISPKPDPIPVQTIKKPEQKGPVYRWVAVKAESMKTPEEKQAEIKRLNPNLPAPKTSNTNTLRRKSRLCTYCRNKKEQQRLEKTRAQLLEERKLEELRQKSIRKGNNKSKKKDPGANTGATNRFSSLLAEESG